MNYSANFSGALDKAAGLASRTGGLVCTEHLLYGLAAQGGCNAQRILASVRVTADEVLQLFRLGDQVSRVTMSTRANRAINNSTALARQTGAAQVNTEHLLFAVLYDRESVAAQVLEKRWGVDVGVMSSKLWQEITGESERERQPQQQTADLSDIIDSFIGSFFGGAQPQRNESAGADSGAFRPSQRDGAEGGGRGSSALPEELAQFGTDLTAKARR